MLTNVVVILVALLSLLCVRWVVTTLTPHGATIDVQTTAAQGTPIGSGSLVISTTHAAIAGDVSPGSITGLAPGGDEVVDVTIQNVGQVPLQPTIALQGAGSAITASAAPCTTCQTVTLGSQTSPLPITIQPGGIASFPVTITGTDALQPNTTMSLRFVLSGVQA